MNTLAVNHCQLFSNWLDESDLKLVNQCGIGEGSEVGRDGTDSPLEIGKFPKM